MPLIVVASYPDCAKRVREASRILDLVRSDYHPAYPTRPAATERLHPLPGRRCTASSRGERYNRTVRHEWLDQYIIESIEEAQDHATQWLWTYNNDRPNMGIGGFTPAMKLKMAA
jgi:transposase InsO family protein